MNSRLYFKYMFFFVTCLILLSLLVSSVLAANGDASHVSLDMTDVEENATFMASEIISAGGFHSCGVKGDGTLVCWGENDVHQSSPPGGIFTQVSAGNNHTCGLKSDGTVACWGWNGLGESTPPGGIFTQVSAGDNHTCGLKSDRTVVCWGSNNYGQSISPAGTFTQVSVGGDHNCGLKEDASVYCWGNNGYGQSTPPSGTFKQVSAGLLHTCGLKSDDTVICWGNNPWAPQATVPPVGTFKQVSSGNYHTCGLKSDDTITCWGNNDTGQSSPPEGTFIQVSAGHVHTCGLKSDRTVACWGRNNEGQATPPAGIFGYAVVANVLIKDESADPVSGAQVFRNGNFTGTTTTDGTLSIPDLATGDQLVARLRVTEVPTGKNNHNQDSSQNWAYRVYITSLDVPKNGNPTPWIVTNPSTPQTLTIKKSNTLIGFNIVASVEWDANTSYLNELQQGFEKSSEYLYDATDGQMLFERVTIYDNNQNMGDADYQLRASNQEWPRANVSGVLSGDNLHVFLGRYFDGQSANQGSWTNTSGFRTEIHEFGHYGLGLWDSYFYYDNDGNKHDSNCTSLAIRTNLTPEINATLMNYQYNASEFSMQNVSGVWSSECQNTDQWKKNGQSDWETIIEHYQDINSPTRWEMKTPANYAGVVAGPGVQSVSGWSSMTIGSDASGGVCEPPLTYTVEYLGGIPAKGASILLRKGDRTIDQGKTDDNGDITVLGASNGDRLVANLWGTGLRIGSTQVACGALSLSQSASAQSTVIVLEPAAFTLTISTEPGTATDQVKIIVKASTELSIAPETTLTQNGATSVLVPLSYDAVLEAYTGTITLDTNLPPSGNIIAKATNMTGQVVEVTTQFALEQVVSDQDITVVSSDGQAELYLPIGSLSGDGRVNINGGQVSSNIPKNLVLLSGPYTLLADEGLSLVNNANLSLYYLDTSGTLSQVDTSIAKIHRWDGAKWQTLASTSSQAEQVVSAPFDTFGTYALFVQVPIFSDVPMDYWSWGYIERLYAAGITGGCGTAPLIYCPEATVTRGQMAVFLERGMNGSSYSPPPATGMVFSDIPVSYWSASWVENLYANGITGGCGGGNYCPEASVTRAQMAVFLLRAKHGASYSPPPATGDFSDVPTSYWAASWIEQLTAEGITSGCGGGNYCPEQPVSRAQMAVFLVRTFGLP